MTQYSPKTCPRCNIEFICKTDDISNCQCNQVTISKKTIDFLSKTQFDCLCKDCLIYLNTLVNNSQNYFFPARESLIENVHYYKENGYWVFTELYHLLRNSCCKSGCRHCVYGFKKIK
ncbi:cysteine-rich CWC family protein [Bernardetia sp. Wsw4-3y2]|uniref:cysteine-rich CWC family protein n=1 Tax=Bernardetia sp. Wsw4-3y2 TaxID=3127471 RepID=UPI0030CDE5BF